MERKIFLHQRPIICNIWLCIFLIIYDDVLIDIFRCDIVIVNLFIDAGKKVYKIYYSIFTSHNPHFLSYFYLHSAKNYLFWRMDYKFFIDNNFSYFHTWLSTETINKFSRFEMRYFFKFIIKSLGLSEVVLIIIFEG